MLNTRVTVIEFKTTNFTRLWIDFALGEAELRELAVYVKWWGRRYSWVDRAAGTLELGYAMVGFCWVVIAPTWTTAIIEIIRTACSCWRNWVLAYFKITNIGGNINVLLLSWNWIWIIYWKSQSASPQLIAGANHCSKPLGMHCYFDCSLSTIWYSSFCYIQ